MGTTYGGDIPGDYRLIDEHYALETWNRKRIGVAVADKPDGKFERLTENPILDSATWSSRRSCSTKTASRYIFSARAATAKALTRSTAQPTLRE